MPGSEDDDVYLTPGFSFCTQYSFTVSLPSSKHKCNYVCHTCSRLR